MLLAVTAINVAGMCPPAPAQYTFTPASCMSGSGCTKAHCSCGSELVTGLCDKSNTTTLAQCAATVAKLCDANPACHSFAMKSSCNLVDSREYQMFSWGTGSAVPNTDWIAYTKPHGLSPTGPSSRPDGADPELDCMIRRLALARASQILPRRGVEPVVFDALELGRFCNDTRPVGVLNSIRWPAGRSSQHHHDAAEFVVDPIPGRCRRNTSPFCSVHDALAAARRSTYPSTTTATACTKNIVLNDGIHYLNRTTMVLRPSDSGTCIVAAPGASPTLSGGTPYSVTWTADATQPGVLVASLEGLLPHGALPDQLFIAGRREIRAKMPNGDPETTGLHTEGTVSGSGYFTNKNAGEWGGASGGAKGRSAKTSESRTHPHCPKFSGTFGVARYNSTFSHWGATARPTKLTWDPSNGPNITAFANPSSAVIHAFHGSHWGGWMFRVLSQDFTNKTFTLDPLGGQQEARGDSTGAEWYIENARELLDAPREWYFDVHTSKLYYMPNSTAEYNAALGYREEEGGNADALTTIVIPSLKTLIKIEGTQAAPVKGITVQDITFTHSLTTYLDVYHVPSAGDWSIHRGAAVFVEGAENVTVEACKFTRLGGNAIMFADYVRDAAVVDSEFVWIGDSAVATLGTTRYSRTGDQTGNDIMDASDGEHPERVLFRGNLAHEIGVYGKQTSAFASNVASHETVVGNVLFNGPRAGVNWNGASGMHRCSSSLHHRSHLLPPHSLTLSILASLSDGMGGGNNISDNLMFNWVRETSDHGCFNSWDRVPFLTKDPATKGKITTDVLPTVMERNFMISNYASTWPIDHDDCSCYYHDTYNFLVYAGAKNYLGMSKISAHNVYVDVDLNGFKVCAVDDSPWTKGGEDADIYANNTCITGSGVLYHDSRCSTWDLKNTVDNSYGNSFLVNKLSNVGFPCPKGKKNLSFSEFQAKGFEKGSTVSARPPAKDIIIMGKKVLGM